MIRVGPHLAKRKWKLLSIYAHALSNTYVLNLECYLIEYHLVSALDLKGTQLCIMHAYGMAD